MTDTFETAVRDTKDDETTLLLSKHRDYGPENIARAPGGPVNGLAVRLHDKVARLAHLIGSGADPEHEALIDTALDIANYGTILSLVLKGEWPGTAPAYKKFRELKGAELGGEVEEDWTDVRDRHLGSSRTVYAHVPADPLDQFRWRYPSLDDDGFPRS